MHHGFVALCLFRLPLFMAVSVAVGACGSDSLDNATSATLCGDGRSGPCSGETESSASPATVDSLEPFVVGDNTCFMALGYFPRTELTEMLPERLSIPNDAVMATHYPNTKLRDEAHPFMLSFCHGSNIHDVLTGISVPEQEEIMFVFPVMYDDGDGMHLCSYVPVLYLDSFLGFLGGFVFGLRKEFHPGMKHGDLEEGGHWWRIDGVVDAEFDVREGEDLEQLPVFIAQTFSNPFVSVSYPLPFKRMVFYEARVFASTVVVADEAFEWVYRGTTVSSSDDTWSIYSEYSFSMSLPTSGQGYFAQARSP